MKTPIVFWFESEEQKEEFLGQLIDGFGENYVEVKFVEPHHFDTSGIKHYDVSMNDFAEELEDFRVKSFYVSVDPFNSDPVQLSKDLVNRLIELSDEEDEESDD